ATVDPARNHSTRALDLRFSHRYWATSSGSSNHLTRSPTRARTDQRRDFFPERRISSSASRFFVTRSTPAASRTVGAISLVLASVPRLVLQIGQSPPQTSSR